MVSIFMICAVKQQLLLCVSALMLCFITGRVSEGEGDNNCTIIISLRLWKCRTLGTHKHAQTTHVLSHTDTHTCDVLLN